MLMNEPLCFQRHLKGFQKNKHKLKVQVVKRVSYPQDRKKYALMAKAER